MLGVVLQAVVHRLASQNDLEWLERTADSPALNLLAPESLPRLLPSPSPPLGPTTCSLSRVLTGLHPLLARSSLMAKLELEKVSAQVVPDRTSQNGLVPGLGDGSDHFSPSARASSR